MTKTTNPFLFDVIEKPIITEKSTLQSGSGQYFFAVRRTATKPEIKKAVEALFNVKVKDVNTLIRKGKSKTFKGFKGMQQDVKKAMVTLHPNYKIDLASGV